MTTTNCPATVPRTECDCEHPVLPRRHELIDFLRESADWPQHLEVEDVVPARVWVSRDRGITFELRVKLRANGRDQYALLQGGVGSAPPLAVSTIVELSPDGWITGFRGQSERLNIWCLSPELDSHLPAIESLWNHGGDKLASSFDVEHVDPFLTLLRCSHGQSDDRNDHHLSARYSSTTATCSCHPNPTTDLTTRLVGYRTGKRCVIRARFSENGRETGVFIKHFRRPPKESVLAGREELARQVAACTNDRVRVPRLIAFGQSERIAVFEEIAQQPHPVDFLASVDNVCEALAAIHHTTLLSSLPVHTLADELDTVARWRTGLAAVSADDRDRSTLDRLVDRLANYRSNLTDGDSVVLHRDFHLAQLLRTESNLWITDWDTLAAGHAEVDLATLLAHLVLEELRKGASKSCAELAEPCLAAYRKNGGRVNAERLHFYLPAALARLGALHLARSLPAEIVHRLWSDAETMLAGGERGLTNDS